jgi:hypothetical protein
LDLSDLKQRLTGLESLLDERPIVELGAFDTPCGLLRVEITDRFRRRCRRNKQWKSKRMLAALKNVQYGFDQNRQRSSRGQDGIFRVDRDFKPANEMMRKIFDRFLDKPDPLAVQLAERMGVARREMMPVRVVSHRMRLLGVLADDDGTPRLVLVDCDDTKDA